MEKPNQTLADLLETARRAYYNLSHDPDRRESKYIFDILCQNSIMIYNNGDPALFNQFSGGQGVITGTTATMGVPSGDGIDRELRNLATKHI